MNLNLRRGLSLRLSTGDSLTSCRFVTLYQVETNGIVVAGNYASDHQYLNGTVSTVDVMRACIASPTYFKEAKIDGNTYLDGSLGAANPSMFAIQEAKSVWNIDPDDIGTFVSLGTGLRSQEPRQLGRFGTISMIKAFTIIVTDSQIQHERILEVFERGRNMQAYYRFNAGSDLGSITLFE